MTQTFYLPATHSDIEQIKCLMEKVFGPYPKLDEIFNKWITQDQYNVVVAKINEKVIGVSTWCLKPDMALSAQYAKHLNADAALFFMGLKLQIS